MDLAELTPARVLIARYQLEAQMMSPGSISGHQLQQAQQGLSGVPSDGGRLNGTAEIGARLADLLLLCKELSELEDRICRARYSEPAGVIYHEALRRVGDLREGDGIDIIEVRPKDAGGQPLGDQWVRVRGPRARYPSHQEIAARLALTSRQVQRYQVQACGKVAARIKAQAEHCAKAAPREFSHPTFRRDCRLFEKTS